MQKTGIYHKDFSHMSTKTIPEVYRVYDYFLFQYENTLLPFEKIKTKFLIGISKLCAIFRHFPI